MNYYKLSDGSKLPKSTIDRKIRDAKKLKKDMFLLEHGFIFCEECKRSSGTRFDMSHDISVDECQKSGRSELAYDVNNITIRCRECHIKHDNL